MGISIYSPHTVPSKTRILMPEFRRRFWRKYNILFDVVNDWIATAVFGGQEIKSIAPIKPCVQQVNDSDCAGNADASST